MSHDPISFEDLALASPLLQAIHDLGYESPSPIQAQSIPPLLEGRDLLGQAQTGTGKTAAFALPLLHRLQLGLRKPQALILTPTRELALQVSEAMQTYARHIPGFAISALYGGQGMHTQLRELARGVHVVVGTPGRILDHLRRKTLVLDALSTLVLDEADEMLRMGFLEDVQTILDQTPESKQVALFSATMPDAIKRIAQRYLRTPVEIQIRTKTATVSTVDQRYWKVVDTDKIDGLTRILEAEEIEAALIFVRTKVAATEISEKLQSRGFSCGVLSGDMNQAQREATVEQIKNGTCDLIVATDVAARGLDIDRISHVINFDIPFDPETYVHRIGRTGRAGRSGHAILFVSPREMRILRTIEKVIRIPIRPMSLPSLADIVKRRTSAFKQRIALALQREDLGFFDTILREIQTEQNKEPLQIASALAFLLQEERPLLPPPFPEEEAEAAAPREWIMPEDSEIEDSLRTYRIEVGRQHGVLPKHIVGALTHEMNLESRYIGQIKLFDDFSIVDLPGGMSKSVLMQLKKLRVRGQAMRLSPFSGHLPGIRVRTGPLPSKTSALSDREEPAPPTAKKAKPSVPKAPSHEAEDTDSRLPLAPPTAKKAKPSVPKAPSHEAEDTDSRPPSLTPGKKKAERPAPPFDPLLISLAEEFNLPLEYLSPSKKKKAPKAPIEIFRSKGEGTPTHPSGSEPRENSASLGSSKLSKHPKREETEAIRPHAEPSKSHLTPAVETSKALRPSKPPRSSKLSAKTRSRKNR